MITVQARPRIGPEVVSRLSFELGRLNWKLGNDGELEPAQRKHPALPLLTAHHRRFGVLGSLYPDELLAYARAVNEAAVVVAAAGLELTRGQGRQQDLGRPGCGWWVRRGAEGLLLCAHGDVSDLRHILTWVRRHYPAAGVTHAP